MPLPWFYFALANKVTSRSSDQSDHLPSTLVEPKASTRTSCGGATADWWPAWFLNSIR
jgi:hypothetical protein